MTTANDAQHSVLVIGRSQLVLDDTVAGLRDLGYSAEATNEFFSDVTGRFDPKQIALVVFGGAVPLDRKAELTDEISAINPQVIFVQGLAGIPGLIIDQIQGALTADQPDPTRAPRFSPDERSIVLTLAAPADVKVTAYWTTSIVPPHPESDSQELLTDRLASGDHAVQVPEHVPSERAFATVKIDTAIYAFSIATEQ
jgi:hypothetical protein